MRTIEQKVFKFSELDKKVQEKVIEKWYEKEDYPFLESDLEENLKCSEKNIFDNDFKLQYSLSYCQGDGLSIQGDIDKEKILNLLSEELKEKFKGKIYTLSSTGNKGHYCYHSNQDIVYDLDLCDEDDYDEFYTLFEEEVLPIVQNIYNELCSTLEKDGYSILEYRMDIEEFSEFSGSNDYEYFENGKMYF